MNHITLASGHEMPVLGLGTWKLLGEPCRQAVKKALELGYSHIDTAWIYKNQEEVGQGMKDSGVDRKKIFLTTKIWVQHFKYKQVLAEFEEDLKMLNTDHVDLLLLHWPLTGMKETFKALNKLVDDGKVKSIGVSNYEIRHLKKAIPLTKAPICMNQVEYHPYLNQEALRKFCIDNNIHMTAYCPIGRGQIFGNPTIKSIAESHKKSEAQVMLRWLIQKDVVAIPKATTEDHLKENLEIFDFSLAEEEMKKIDNLGIRRRIIDPFVCDFDDVKPLTRVINKIKTLGYVNFYR
ncbi:MAG: aldo/keto reductase [Nanoarchaeota archaeon]|nr:aldo/keto reductase [Nanoarchaeota archaeon]